MTDATGNEGTEVSPAAGAETEVAAVIVNVGVTNGETPTVETPATDAESSVAAIEAAPIVEPVAEEIAEVPPVVEGDVNAPPDELESLAVERAEVEVEQARAEVESTQLENERMAIENERLREAQETLTQEVGVTTDGRSTEATDPKGESEAGRSESQPAQASASGDAGGNGSADNKPKSESGSGNRSSGRAPRFRRGGK